MALTVTNNVASLNAQNNLNRSSSALSKSLEKLSSGLKINRGADGPAALVISEQQRAQIAGIKTAIDNTNKAVSMVQTAEGALNEINGLLVKIRGLALDSANSGVNDTTTLAANQAEIDNALDTIDRIANTTKFGQRGLLNGSSGVLTTLSGNNAGLSRVTAGVDATAGTFVANIGTQGTGGTSTAVAGAAGTVGGSGGFLTITGGGLAVGGIQVALESTDTFTSARTKIETALNNATASGGGAGKFVVDITGGGSDQIRIRSNVLGSAAITVTASSAAVQTATGFAQAGTTGAAGAAAVVTFNGQATSITAGQQGLNNQVQFSAGNSVVSFSISVSNGTTAAAASTTNVTITNNSLSFQIGANRDETEKVSIDQVNTTQLGTGVSGLSNVNTTSLNLINVTSASGAQDAISVVDRAISEISAVRGRLGAFQANTLESSSNNLRATLENTVSAESVVRDTDFASEIAQFTKSQVLLQAGSSVLGNANQIPQLVAALLQ